MGYSVVWVMLAAGSCYSTASRLQYSKASQPATLLLFEKHCNVPVVLVLARSTGRWLRSTPAKPHLPPETLHNLLLLGWKLERALAAPLSAVCCRLRLLLGWTSFAC